MNWKKYSLLIITKHYSVNEWMNERPSRHCRWFNYHCRSKCSLSHNGCILFNNNHSLKFTGWVNCDHDHNDRQTFCVMIIIIIAEWILNGYITHTHFMMLSNHMEHKHLMIIQSFPMVNRMNSNRIIIVLINLIHS